MLSTKTFATLLLLTTALLAACGEATTAELDAGAPNDASVLAADDATNDAGCLHWARPTGTCTQPDTCCVSSICVDGICR